MDSPGAARILLVDDDELVLDTFALALQNSPYHVVTATGGAQALALMEKQTIDVILSDQCMPEMTGDTLLAQVAERWPDVERIMITGFATMDALIRGVNNGNMGYYLSKPIQQQHLLEALELGVNRTRRRRALRDAERALHNLRKGEELPRRSPEPPTLWSPLGLHASIEEVLEA